MATKLYRQNVRAMRIRLNVDEHEMILDALITAKRHMDGNKTRIANILMKRLRATKDHRRT